MQYTGSICEVLKTKDKILFNHIATRYFSITMPAESWANVVKRNKDDSHGEIP